VNCTTAAAPAYSFSCEGKATGMHTLSHPDGKTLDVYCRNGWALVLLNSTYNGTLPATEVKHVTADQIGGSCQHVKYVDNGSYSQSGVQGNATDFMLGLDFWPLLGNRMRLEVGTTANQAITNESSRSAVVDHFYVITDPQYRMWMNSSGSGSVFAAQAHVRGFRMSASNEDRDSAHTKNCASAEGGGFPWWYGKDATASGNCGVDGSMWGNSSTSGPNWNGLNQTSYTWGRIWVRWQAL
jgi:hypothetical protein